MQGWERNTFMLKSKCEENLVRFEKIIQLLQAYKMSGRDTTVKNFCFLTLPLSNTSNRDL